MRIQEKSKFAVGLLQVSDECDKTINGDASSVPLPPGWQRHEGVMLRHLLHLLNMFVKCICHLTYCLIVAFKICL